MLKIRVYLRAPIIVYGSAQAPPKERFGSLLSKMAFLTQKMAKISKKMLKKRLPKAVLIRKHKVNFTKFAFFDVS